MHTPKPWKIFDYDNALYVDGTGRNTICRIASKTDANEEKANARLIATAPELLQACKIALDALGCDRSPEDRLEAQRIIHKAVEKSQAI